MLSLNTNLTLDTVRKSKLGHFKIEWRNWYNHSPSGKWAILDHQSKFKITRHPAPTLADIIDNAEELFGEECWLVSDKINNIFKGETEDKWSEYRKTEIEPEKCRCVCKKVKHFEDYKVVASKLIEMCQQDKPLKEIEEYIIINIK